MLPISYHAEKGSGAVVRTILAGTDALFWNWLSFLREQFVAFVGLIVLVPTAIYMNAQDGADPGGARRRLRARQRVRGAQDQHRPGRRRALPQQRLRPRRRRARQRHGRAELRALRLRDAGHAHDHGRAADRAIPGPHLVGPADGADAHRRHHHGGRHLCGRRPARLAGQDHRRRDRGLRRLRRPADRQARPAVGLRRAHLPVRADAQELLRPARRHRRRAREAGRQAARQGRRQRALRGRDVPLQEQRPGRFRRQLRGAGRPDRRARRPHRRGQDHDARPAAAAARARQAAASSSTATTSPT